MSTFVASPFTQTQKMTTDIITDRLAQLRAFDETKHGVKGLVDAGVTTIPSIFVHPSKYTEPCKEINSDKCMPTIDLTGIETDPEIRKEVVKQVHEALDKWGFFKLVNHGIPLEVMDAMIAGTKRFYDQDHEIKKRLYDRKYTKQWMYNSNFDLYSGVATNWRDTFSLLMAPYPPNPEDIPDACREIILEYTVYVRKLAKTLFELISEALGLKPSHLNDIGCTDGLEILGNIYPACPQPELTTGILPHADNDFLTILLHDICGGLQVRHEGEWYEVPPQHGALVVNSGELLQLITNDKYKSVEHKKLSHPDTRYSVASFITTGHQVWDKRFGPVKELLSNENPAIYSDVTVQEYAGFHRRKGLGGISALEHYKIKK